MISYPPLIKLIDMAENDDEKGLSVPDDKDVSKSKPKFELPGLDNVNLQIALSKLSESRYAGLSDVAKILMPAFEKELEALRADLSLVINPKVSIVPSEVGNMMSGDSIMLGLVNLFLAEYQDLLGVAKSWVPDFDRKIELMEAKNPILIPTIANSYSVSKGGATWACMVRICYEMDRPVSIKELDSITDMSGCFPARPNELDTVCEYFPKLAKPPVATAYNKEFDDLMRRLRCDKPDYNWFYENIRKIFSLILKHLPIPAATPGQNNKWYIVQDPEKPIKLEKGNRMPPGVKLVAVCSKEFWQPLADRKKDEE